VVAPRSLPEPERTRPGVIPPQRAGDRVDSIDAVVGLARRWAALGPVDDPDVVVRLTALLRRLGSTLRAEPFWPIAARAAGVDLLRSGFCGDPDAEDVLPMSLGLLRMEALAAFGMVGHECERRLRAALDEMVAGFARALRDRAMRDRAERDRASRDQSAADPHYRAVYDHGAVGIGIATLDGLVLDLNPALQRMFGMDGPLDRPRPMSDFVHPDDLADALQRHRQLIKGDSGTARMDLRLVRPDSEVMWVRVVASLVRHDDGSPSHIMGIVEDISDRHRLRSRLQHTSAKDQLTRLPGQVIAEQWLQRAFDGGATRVGICALDLDGFHAVNDALGEHVGDRLLLGVAGRLHLVARDHLVTRTGGDEFMVLVADPEDVVDVGRLAERLQTTLSTPFCIGGESVTLTASIGVAESATARTSAAELMRAADIAQSWARALGGGRTVEFDHERDAGEAARFALLAGLRGALDRGEFRLVFQPLVRLSDGRPQGAEALVRWQHPEQGLIGPGRFIELAEHSGAIVPLGRWVLETACAQAAEWWRSLGDDAPYVSVNVSPVQLGEGDWVREVTDVLAATGLPARKLQLEITEKAVLGDEAAALAALSALRDAGVRIALDDFGTGYSSLAWLRTLPVHALKIDGSFIDGLRKEPADAIDSLIVQALVRMAHALGLEVTAEWVETPLQAERLVTFGCDVGQGRWFGDAGPAEWVLTLLRRSIDS
jgi:diguanylate cyclase (GGDEF)-like protein/PAS domain S-box-containing protein